MKRWKRLSTGIYADQYGLEAVVNCAAGRKTRRFPRATNLAVIQQWRKETKVRLEALGRPRHTVTAKLPLPPNHLPGWCYLYVIGNGANVKIGCARDPQYRLKKLQTGNDWRLELLAAVPAHVSLEKAVHQRFAHLQLAGEWFQLTAEVQQFIDDLRARKNPALWLW